MKQTITLTFGDHAENHVGMQVLGKRGRPEKVEGFDVMDLERFRTIFQDQLGNETELYNLNQNLPLDTQSEEEALLLIVRGGVDGLLRMGSQCPLEEGGNPSEFVAHSTTSLDLLDQLKGLEPDRTYYDSRRKKVLNKHARFNLCFSDTAQEADMIHGKGTVISFRDLPALHVLHTQLQRICGLKGVDLQAEGNYYYDVHKCGIGYHGDSERKLVVGARLGASMPLHFQWFQRFKPVGRHFDTILDSGDMYFMSEKAVGWDWKMSSKLTLRHAAGCDKYTKLN